MLQIYGTEIIEACDSCCMSWFGASIVLVFILEVEFYDYLVDGEICESLAEGPNG